MKKRFINNEKLEYWFASKLDEMVKITGLDLEYEIAEFCDEFKGQPMIIAVNIEETWKAIDKTDYYVSAIEIGLFIEKHDLKVFQFMCGTSLILVLAKNNADFQSRVTRALEAWKAANTHKRSPTRNEKIDSLLREIYNHINDQKYETNMGTDWCNRIEDILVLNR